MVLFSECRPVHFGRSQSAGGGFDREWKMTVHTPKLLTPEEFAALIEVAITPQNPSVPPHHLSKLISLGYVIMSERGPLVTGDGLVRITESE